MTTSKLDRGAAWQIAPQGLRDPKPAMPARLVQSLLMSALMVAVLAVGATSFQEIVGGAFAKIGTCLGQKSCQAPTIVAPVAQRS